MCRLIKTCREQMPYGTCFQNTPLRNSGFRDILYTFRQGFVCFILSLNGTSSFVYILSYNVAEGVVLLSEFRDSSCHYITFHFMRRMEERLCWKRMSLNAQALFRLKDLASQSFTDIHFALNKKFCYL